jgi:hypothetical protein
LVVGSRPQTNLVGAKAQVGREEIGAHVAYVITALLVGVLLALIYIYRKLMNILLEIELLRTHHFKANRNAIEKQDAIDEENMEKMKANLEKMKAASMPSQAG